MERDTKRSTSFIKRSEFENARKLLFGTEIIPGTKGRERWTTAGLFKVPLPNRYEFQLGKFTFDISTHGLINLKNGTKWLSIGRLMKDSINIEIINYFTESSYTYVKLDDDNTYSVKSKYSKFKKELFYNALHAYETITFYNSMYQFDNENFLLPDQMNELNEFISKNKMVNRYEKIQAVYKFRVHKKDTVVPIGEAKKPFKDGLIYLSDDAKMVIASDRRKIDILLVGKVPVEALSPIFGGEEKELCFYIDEDKKTQCIFLSDMRYIAEAVNMLMHVLTGPDPRSYYPAESSDLPFKETSDPFTEYFVFTQDEDGAYYASWEDEIYFFKYDEKSMTYQEAIKLRDYVIDYLMRYQEGDFAYNYAKFMAGRLTRPSSYTPKEMEEMSEERQEEMKNLTREQIENMIIYTPAGFKKALYRIRRFEMWEYMGGEVY